jgi:hypothetical protein
LLIVGVVIKQYRDQAGKLLGMYALGCFGEGGGGGVDWRESRLTAVGKAFIRCALVIPSSSKALAVPMKWEVPATAPPVLQQ